MKKNISFLVLFSAGVVLLSVLIGFGPRSVLEAENLEKTPLGKAPEWKLKDVDEKWTQSGDFKGKVILLDFWATWCPPCRAEIPVLVELQKKYGAKGLQVIGVSLDQEGAGVVKKFMDQYKINYPVVMGDDEVTKAFGGIEGIPTTFLINQDGSVISKHVGFSDQVKIDMEKEIEKILK